MRFQRIIILKMARLRIRWGKTGRNGRDVMRFQRVIISLESRIVLESRVTARGVAGSEIVALHAARGVIRSAVIRSAAMNCGTPLGLRPEPSLGLSRKHQARR